MANTGILLRKDNKQAFVGDFLPQEGEMVFAQDTFEIGMMVDGELYWQTWVSTASSANYLLYGDDEPTNDLGDNSDKYIQKKELNGFIELVEFKKEDGEWRQIHKGVTQDWLTANLEVGIHDETYPYLGKYNYKMQDGYTPFVDLDVATKYYLDNVPGVAGKVTLDGTSPMDVGYVPSEDMDLVTSDYMMSGDAEVILPTTEPDIANALWNDFGTLKLSTDWCDIITPWTNPAISFFYNFGRMAFDPETGNHYGYEVANELYFLKFNKKKEVVQKVLTGVYTDTYYETIDLAFFDGSLYFASPNYGVNNEWHVLKMNKDTMAIEGTCMITKPTGYAINYGMPVSLGFNSDNGELLLSYLNESNATGDYRYYNHIDRINTTTMTTISTDVHFTDPDSGKGYLSGSFDSHGKYYNAVVDDGDTHYIYKLDVNTNVEEWKVDLPIDAYLWAWNEGNLIIPLPNGNVFAVYQSKRYSGTYNNSFRISILDTNGVELSNWLFLDNVDFGELNYSRKYGRLGDGTFYFTLGSRASDGAGVYLFNDDGSLNKVMSDVDRNCQWPNGGLVKCGDNYFWSEVYGSGQFDINMVLMEEISYVLPTQ